MMDSRANKKYKDSVFTKLYTWLWISSCCISSCEIATNCSLLISLSYA
jgi:hypothetical protein